MEGEPQFCATPVGPMTESCKICSPLAGGIVEGLLFGGGRKHEDGVTGVWSRYRPCTQFPQERVGVKVESARMEGRCQAGGNNWNKFQFSEYKQNIPVLQKKAEEHGVFMRKFSSSFGNEEEERNMVWLWK